MTLRTRLILVLLLLSVVPLGAVTMYSYLNSADAMRTAAAREADLLAGELTSRMQLVTAELSNRVERLMEMPEQTAPATRSAATLAKATPASDVKPVARPGAATATGAAALGAIDAVADTVSSVDQEVARALGDAALLLNRVELQGVRNIFGGRGGRPGGPPSNPANPAQSVAVGSASPVPPSTTSSAQSSGTQVGPVTAVTPRPNPGRGGQGRGSFDPSIPRGFRRDADGKLVPRNPGAMPKEAAKTGPSSRPANPADPPPAPLPANPAPPAQTPASPVPNPAALPGAPVVPQAPPAPPAGDRFVVDFSQIAKDMAKRMAPEGLDKLTPEERQRVQREMGLRMMGITEGIRMGAAEIAKRAEDAKQKAAEAAKLNEAKSKSTKAAAVTPAPQPAQTKSSLRGNQLGVTVSRGGKVVHTASAEVNLDNLLMTVFSTTRRDQGEVPFAVAKDGKIYTQNAADRTVVQTFGAAVKPDTKVGTTTLRNWIIVTNEDPSGSGLRFGIARPVGDSLSALRKTAGRNAGLGLLFIGLAFVIVWPVSQGLTKGLSSLTDGVQRIAKGDFAARVPVKGGGEVTALARAFNQMAEDVEKHQHALVEQERLKRELELGRQIQSEMLPHEPLRFGLTEVKGVSIPAREVGGDFFNYFAMPDGNVALLVGDVSGKGVGAALLMANVQATLRARLAMEQDLPAIADAIDRDISTNAPRGLYSTLFVGILTPSTNKLRYVNAGHNPQFVLRKSGGEAGPNTTANIERLVSTGTPIGLLAGRGYSQGEIQLASGDYLFFYTDGVVEAENEAGEMFGADRLEALVSEGLAHPDAGPDAVLQRIERSVKAFRGTREPFDDATMMVLRIG
jgi:serine phosphatase RsbU (regulator of sigma subunit)